MLPSLLLAISVMGINVQLRTGHKGTCMKGEESQEKNKKCLRRPLRPPNTMSQSCQGPGQGQPWPSLQTLLWFCFPAQKAQPLARAVIRLEVAVLHLHVIWCREEEKGTLGQQPLFKWMWKEERNQVREKWGNWGNREAEALAMGT